MSDSAQARRGHTDFEQLFVANYESIRGYCSGLDKAGVALLAIDSESAQLTVSNWTEALPGTINATIIGRHGKADLQLDRDDTISLRHMTLVVYPSDRDWCEPGAEQLPTRFRLLDLRTGLAFRDEAGRTLEALQSDGPVIVECGRYVLYLLVTGSQQHWPSNPEEGWRQLPARMYVDNRDANPTRWSTLPPSPAAREVEAVREPTTLVSVEEGPIEAKELMLTSGDTCVGEFELYVGDQAQGFVLGEAAARAGVLLGKYTRCDSDSPALLRKRRVSRVHLLILMVEDRLYAIDTASTNGSATPDEGGEMAPASVVALTHRMSMMLARGEAIVSWFPKAA